MTSSSHLAIKKAFFFVDDEKQKQYNSTKTKLRFLKRIPDIIRRKKVFKSMDITTVNIQPLSLTIWLCNRITSLDTGRRCYRPIPIE